MSQTPQTRQKPTSSFYMIALMGAVSTICGLIIVTADIVTAQTIRENLAQLTREAVNGVLPGTDVQVGYVVDAASGELKPIEEGTDTEPNLFACFQKGSDGTVEFLGVVCQATGKGYGGTLKALYAWSPEKRAITGFKVLESKETPGLGDKILTDPAFRANFDGLAAVLGPDGKSLEHPIETVKSGAKTQPWQVDAISGATVSSRAVGDMLNRSAGEMLPLAQQHLDTLMKGGV